MAKAKKVYHCAVCNVTFAMFAELRSHEKGYNHREEQGRAMRAEREKREAEQERVRINLLFEKASWPTMLFTGDTYNYFSRARELGANGYDEEQVNELAQLGRMVAEHQQKVQQELKYLQQAAQRCLDDMARYGTQSSELLSTHRLNDLLAAQGAMKALATPLYRLAERLKIRVDVAETPRSWALAESLNRWVFTEGITGTWNATHAAGAEGDVKLNGFFADSLDAAKAKAYAKAYAASGESGQSAST